jgi:hypothetical protein
VADDARRENPSEFPFGRKERRLCFAGSSWTKNAYELTAVKWYDARVMAKLLLLALAALCASCTPQVPPHPALAPITAERLLHYDARAQNRLKHIKSEDPTCDFKVLMPDQSNHPDSIEANHVVSCGGRTDLKQFDANAEFRWNKERGQWELAYFGS